MFISHEFIKLCRCFRIVFQLIENKINSSSQVSKWIRFIKFSISKNTPSRLNWKGKWEKNSFIQSFAYVFNELFFSFRFAFLPPLKNIYFFPSSHPSHCELSICERKMREFLDVVVRHTMWEPYKLDGSRNICVRMLTQSWNIERSQKRALPLSLCLLLHKNHSTSFFTLTTSSMESAPFFPRILKQQNDFFFSAKTENFFFAWVIKKFWMALL